MWAKHLYGWTETENERFWDFYYETIMENVEPKENAVEVIKELYYKHDIILITARWDKKDGVITEITKKWLAKQGIKYHKLFMGQEDKRKIAQENEIDLFIDDNITTCQQISGIGIKTWMMNSRNNKGLKEKNLERVFSWKEIKERINFEGGK